MLRATPIRAVGSGGFAIGVYVAGGAVAEFLLLSWAFRDNPIPLQHGAQGHLLGQTAF